jgi:RHS repeat-associated protein
LYDYTFAFAPRETRIRDSLGHETTVTLNDNGQPVQEVDALGGVTAFDYDDAGRTAAVTDPVGRRVAWQYDDRGNLAQLMLPDGKVVGAEYDSASRATSLVNPDGGTLTFEYDRGRMVSRSAPKGGQWTYQYDDAGDLVRAADATGVETGFERDRFGNVVGVTTAAGSTTKLARDGLGNTTERVDATSRRWSYSYDAKGRPIEAEYPGGDRVACEYDGENNLISYTDENGVRTQLRYLGLGEVAERITPDGQRVVYRYDSEERLLAVVNERGQEHRFERDAMGRVVTEVDYWGHGRHLEYDGAGQLSAVTTPTGERIEIERDAMGRMIRREDASGAVDTYQYDGLGNLVLAENGDATLSRAFDEDGNLVREMVNGLTIESEYDLAGRRVERRSWLGNELGASHDSAGRPHTLVVNGRVIVETEYDQLDRISEERLGRHLKRRYRYDGSGRLAAQDLQTAGESVSQQQFEYDAHGNVVRRRNGRSGLTSLQYDGRGRLVRFGAGSEDDERFEYDPAGSLAQALDGDLQPGEVRAARSRGVDCYYDAGGRLLRRIRSGRETRYTWDALGRLRSCTSDSDGEIRFGYDGLGRRVRKVVGDREIQFAWDGDQLVADVPADGPASEFVYRPRTFEPIASLNDRLCYFETDHAGVPHAVVAEGGEVVWQAEYGAFGEVAALPVHEAHNPLRLQGQYYDEETGLAYNRHRYYDPHFGAFISQDPLGQAAGTDLYAYGPSVWNWVDVFGLNCTKTVTVYRVEGPGNSRVNVGADGNVSIPDTKKMLHVSFGDPAHAEYFLKKTHARGHTDNVIKAFEVPESVVKDIQEQAVPQNMGKKFPDSPQIDDPSISKELGMAETDVLGLRGPQIEALEQNAIPGSGRTL